MRIESIFAPAAGLALAFSPASGLAKDPLEAMMSGQSMMTGKKLQKAVAKASISPFGSAANPVRAAMPEGQRAYLSRLRCSGGDAPKFQRGGSVGNSPYGNIMDVYVVTCTSSDPAKSDVYMDMYHRGYVEQMPVVGFTITSP